MSDAMVSVRVRSRGSLSAVVLNRLQMYRLPTVSSACLRECGGINFPGCAWF